jgi:hypothetical protein
VIVVQGESPEGNRRVDARLMTTLAMPSGMWWPRASSRDRSTPAQIGELIGRTQDRLVRPTSWREGMERLAACA